MKHIIIPILLCILLVACNYDSDDSKPIAHVLGSNLYLHQLPVFNDDFSNDSILFVKDFINEWAIHKIFVHKAEFNLKKDQFYIDSLVNVYRESLLIHYYKQALIQNYLDTIIHDSLVRNYHIENLDNFLLKEDILKMNYVKIRNVAPDLDFIAQRYTSDNTEDIDQLKDYCFQFADRFFLDDVSWVSFSDFVKQLPLVHRANINKQKHFFKKNKSIELEDENYKYFIFIKDFKLKGASSPLEYVSSSIRKILLNKRKKDIIYSIEEKLIQEALESNDFKIYE